MEPGQEVRMEELVEQVIEELSRKELGWTKTQLDAIEKDLIPILLRKLASAFPALIAAPLQKMSDALVADLARKFAATLEAGKLLIAKWRGSAETVGSPLRNVYCQCADELEALAAQHSNRGGLLHFR